MIDPTPPTQSEFSQLPSMSERRHGKRYLFRRRPMVRFLVRPSFQSGRAFLQDVSRIGLSLLLSHRLEPGAVLFIQMRGTRKGNTHTHLAKVVHVTRQPTGVWVVGCRLTCPLSDEELGLALGEE